MTAQGNGRRRIVVGVDGSPASGGGRILVGVDGSPASGKALRWAAGEAELRGMRLHVVYVRHQPAVVPACAPLGSRAGEADRPAEEAALEEWVGSQTWPTVRLELADGLPVRV